MKITILKYAIITYLFFCFLIGSAQINLQPSVLSEPEQREALVNIRNADCTESHQAIFNLMLQTDEMRVRKVRYYYAAFDFKRFFLSTNPKECIDSLMFPKDFIFSLKNGQPDSLLLAGYYSQSKIGQPCYYFIDNSLSKEYKYENAIKRILNESYMLEGQVFVMTNMRIGDIFLLKGDEIFSIQDKKLIPFNEYVKSKYKTIENFRNQFFDPFSNRKINRKK